jgi:hypothetical protein
MKNFIFKRDGAMPLILFFLLVITPFASAFELHIGFDEGKQYEFKQNFYNVSLNVSGTFVPYSGATSPLNLGTQSLTAGSTTLSSLNVTGNVVIGGNVSMKRPYGAYSSTETQTIASTNVAYPITFNWTDDDFEINKELNANFSVDQSGDYLIIISAIAQATTPGSRVQIWVQKNGVNIPRTNTIYDFKSSNANTVIAVPFVLDLNPTDKFRVMWAGDNTGIKLQYYTNTSYSPETPSIIMTITKLHMKFWHIRIIGI